MESTNRHWIRRTAVLLITLLSLMLVAAWLFLGKTAAANQSPFQNNLCVRADGANGCYSTIQAAVDAAGEDDTITIAAGTYTESVQITRNLTISGGWQPPGWPLTETVVQANGADCAISLTTVSGSLNNLTATGGNTAGICGTDLLIYAMENITARNNIGDGAALEVSQTLTVSQSTFNENGRVGLFTPCTYGQYMRDTIVTISHSTANGNGLDGFNGGFGGGNCNYHLTYQNINALENSANGFGGFGGICPARPENSNSMMIVEISESTIKDNGIGITAYCGSGLILHQNRVQNNGIGIKNNEAGLISINNLYTDNLGNGLEIRGGGFNSTNDTIANNGLGELVLFDDAYPSSVSSLVESACDTPTVHLTNSIIWDNHRGIEWFPAPLCIPYFIQPMTVEIQYSLISGRELLVDEEGIIYFTIGSAVHDGDPLFAGNGSYQLIAPSPAIDKGTAIGAPAVDIAGQPRPQDGDGNGTAEFDIGAHEAPPGFIWRVFSPLVR